jgi:threonylcarbamoyladenosine tRNA methylthiotransferase MtaB
MKKIAFYTLGCKVNQSDTASMEKLFRDAGFEIVGFEDDADIYLINTCVVTNMGQSKSRKIIHRAARKEPKPLIVVTGCYPQAAPDEVAHIEGVDLLIGNQDRSKVVDLVRERLGEDPTDAPINAVHDLPVGSGFEELDAAVDASRNRAFLKIQEGCDQYCAYCIIPYARGHLRSRSLENIKEEVARLAAENYKEVVLIGIHLGCYGKEIPGGPRLSDAVKVALSVPGVPRFRLGSLESVEVEDELLKLMVENPRLCAHLHLPLQAGCDATLARMHRPYDTAKFAQLLQRIRSLVPNVAITTDVIVGFPAKRRKISRSPWTSSGSAGSARSTSSPIPSGRGHRQPPCPASFPTKRSRNGCTGWKPSTRKGTWPTGKPSWARSLLCCGNGATRITAFGKV